ncbi:MAG: aminopeptidase P family protein, partial [Sphingomonadales bacterium]|nr:aminopeptidase P family protein [Sphingomonadales bacterium]
PFLHTQPWVNGAQKAITAKGATLKALVKNPIDAVWSDQPSEPNKPVVSQPLQYSGKVSGDKRSEVAREIKEQGAEVAVLTALDSIAWALNIRSADVLNTPVSLAFATIHDDATATLYIDPSKVDAALREHLGNGVEVRDKSTFIDGLKSIGVEGRSVLVDPATASSAVHMALKSAGATIVSGMDPCALPKSRKNVVEQQGSRDAHVRDGAAVSEFLYWLSIEAPKGELDELSAAAKLESIREKGDIFKDLSFRTISAAGPNGALCHYSVSEETNRAIELNSIYLVDSGGQYLDGTTDITRTIAVGTPTAEQKDRFTRVLKGHIALATALFPKGTTGSQLDALARKPLWDVGLDYDHGTGHGVGSYLAVHEGPGRIASVPNKIALEEGMIFSDEPGYYKAGEYGIRIENLVLVNGVETSGDRDMLGFETLTLAPIDCNLVDVALLTTDELAWLNDYHARVYGEISPLVSDATKAWMKSVTAPLG